ncbi:hypothetical protein [Undibacterium sp.]|uniref:hypothetical protein n=1 Tax=Undibacterium sp. TaxID=1914977 RepID=UPI00374CBB59
MHFFLIWLIPIGGAVLAYVFTLEPKKSPYERDRRTKNPEYGVENIGNGDGDYFGGGDR